DHAAVDFAVGEKLVQGRERDEAGIHFEEVAQRLAGIAAAEAVGAQRRKAARHPLADDVRQRLQVVGGGDEDAGRAGERFGDVRNSRFFAGMQPVPALGFDPIGVKRLVAGDAPDVGGNSVILRQDFLGAQGFVQNRAAAKKLRAQRRIRIRRRAVAVHPLEDSFFDVAGHGWHGIRLVHNGDVVEDAFTILVHAPDAVLNDDRNFIGKSRIVGAKIRHRQCEDVTVAVLVLESFAIQRGAAGSAAKQEAAHAHVRSGPDEIGNALEAEHRVVNEEWNRIDAVSGVGGAGGDEGSHRTRFGDAFLENLAVLSFLVVKQRIDVDRFVTLSDAGIDSRRAEERLHAERAGFVRHDGHDNLADLRVLEHLSQHRDIGHGGGNFAALAAGEKFLEKLLVIASQRLGANAALRHIAAEFSAAGVQILNLFAVVGRLVERDVGNLIVAQRNVESGAEFAQLVFVQFLLLVGDVLALTCFTKAVAFNRASENDGGRASMLDRGFIRGVNFARVVAAEAQATELFVRERLDEFQ